jgi:hypothetical protein
VAALPLYAMTGIAFGLGGSLARFGQSAAPQTEGPAAPVVNLEILKLASDSM